MPSFSIIFHLNVSLQWGWKDSVPFPFMSALHELVKLSVQKSAFLHLRMVGFAAWILLLSRLVAIITGAQCLSWHDSHQQAAVAEMFWKVLTVFQSCYWQPAVPCWTDPHIQCRWSWSNPVGWHTGSCQHWPTLHSQHQPVRRLHQQITAYVVQKMQEIQLATFQFVQLVRTKGTL